MARGWLRAGVSSMHRRRKRSTSTLVLPEPALADNTTERIGSAAWRWIPLAASRAAFRAASWELSRELKTTPPSG